MTYFLLTASTICVLACRVFAEAVGMADKEGDRFAIRVNIAMSAAFGFMAIGLAYFAGAA